MLGTLREKLIKIGAKVVRHGRYVTFQPAEVAIPISLFANIVRLIDGLRSAPLPPWRRSIPWHRVLPTGSVARSPFMLPSSATGSSHLGIFGLKATWRISVKPWSSWVALIAAFLALGGALADGKGRASSDVDLLLVIALDVSGSVDKGEFNLQREGLTRALASPQVAEAIVGGVNGSIAVTVVQWSGFIEKIVMVDWVRVSNASDLSRLADEIRQMTRRYDDGATDIGGAISFCQRLFASAPYSGMRRVIDIVGDGTNNVNYSPNLERDRVVETGTTINALAITATTSTLAGYYRDKVIGGAGAFVESAADYSAFETAMLRKLVREIGGRLYSAGADQRLPVISAPSTSFL